MIVNLITYEITNLERRQKTLKRTCLRDDGFYQNKTEYLLREIEYIRERVGNFYQNKTEYLFREIKYLLRENIFLRTES